MSTKTKVDAYEVITNKIIEQLENGCVPWHKPWNGEAGRAKSLASKKAYRGINAFLLGMTPYESPYWLTFRQTKTLGGSVIKGQKGFPVVFWKLLPKKEKNTAGETVTKHIPLLKYYTVFNVEQCQDLDLSKIPQLEEMPEFNHNPIETAESIIKNMPNRPPITHIQNQAFYQPATDIVNMPKDKRFEEKEYYYSVLFHELTHSTGHKSRCNRKGLNQAAAFGSESYSKEELVAELGAAFLCNHAGIINKTIDNSAAYIKSWLKQLKDDKKLIINAAAQAQKSTDYILNITFDN